MTLNLALPAPNTTDRQILPPEIIFFREMQNNNFAPKIILLNKLSNSGIILDDQKSYKEVQRIPVETSPSFPAYSRLTFLSAFVIAEMNAATLLSTKLQRLFGCHLVFQECPFLLLDPIRASTLHFTELIV